MDGLDDAVIREIAPFRKTNFVRNTTDPLPTIKL